MSTSNKTRIVVIGIGEVGSRTAYTLLLRERADELVLIDSDQNKAIGDALDMNHGLLFLGRSKIWAGTYEDCTDADIIIITAGTEQKPEESRMDLLRRNHEIMSGIMSELIKTNTKAIVLITASPVDLMSYFAWEQSGLPASRVIGTGTLLDTARFRYLIGEQMNIDAHSVHAQIIGEHGNSELPLWSEANVAGSELDLSEDTKASIVARTQEAANEVVQAKGSSCYAIALSINRICAAILKDEGSVLNVSTLLKDYHGISDVYLGVPCIVDRQGIRSTIEVKLSDKEKVLLHQSADKLKGLIATTTYARSERNG
ncbi:L-lactate dehydrogenase 1 [Paenibacillus baekrokdamisoli]|uniref:L-lactate dehydrogenase n=1 Tax=Paenibacillus baekrokdamisoli TaxID=1712516 RepID=A0A3G9JJ67_9BACL|nr:L-lactate dehydrogenase [Paenibacillus baekrokdamisoli]MBB3071889.1 L-lactate dehydrogenase [Paenibacillus baekrokdamisoli]BBH24128.1 L-lactate dehydrogenase 1 [Paenibacillus baekrokdamisoli]